ncbi:hypothetical protein GBO22_24265, partial [Mycobacterium avium subsp. hominissuis]|nr:hypothetical protein [Mycobacterium avium subsp. hominissuis]
TRWPSYVRDRHAAITYTTPRDAPAMSCRRASAEALCWGRSRCTRRGVTADRTTQGAIFGQQRY